ncbi:hypothetical protein GIB67_031676 [Kingdonia uniflora]|uniref:Cyclin N-terminal domain-containing protein n=1 Tax=Kingdonia uniflora TaxID=39325 RepID=A0A7J7NJV4_9MAGN|nr:hypothetical protein GIB67_031676 [Kingdonia uniflora]
MNAKKIMVKVVESQPVEDDELLVVKNRLRLAPRRGAEELNTSSQLELSRDARMLKGICLEIEEGIAKLEGGKAKLEKRVTQLESDLALERKHLVFAKDSHQVLMREFTDEAQNNVDEDAATRDSLGCQLLAVGYSIADLEAIIAGTYVEEAKAEEELEVDDGSLPDVVTGLDFVSTRTDLENREGDNEKVMSEEAAEAEEDFYYMWRFHYVILVGKQRWRCLRILAGNKVKKTDVGAGVTVALYHRYYFYEELFWEVIVEPSAQKVIMRQIAEEEVDLEDVMIPGGPQSKVKKKKSMLDIVAQEGVELEDARLIKGINHRMEEEKVKLKSVKAELENEAAQEVEINELTEEVGKNLEEVVVQRDELGRHLLKMGYSKAEVNDIMENTYVEEEEDEADGAKVVRKLDGVFPQTERDSQVDDIVNLENENENDKKTNGWPLQLLSVACLSLATKMEELLVPSILDIQAESVKFIFQPRTVCRMEILVLTTLNWKLRSITPFHFIDFFASKADSTGGFVGYLVTRATQIMLVFVRGDTNCEERVIELEIFKNRWKKAVREDQCWIDPFQQRAARIPSEKLSAKQTCPPKAERPNLHNLSTVVERHALPHLSTTRAHRESTIFLHHKVNRYSTDNCYALQRLLELIFKEGRMLQYIVDLKSYQDGNYKKQFKVVQVNDKTEEKRLYYMHLSNMIEINQITNSNQSKRRRLSECCDLTTQDKKAKLLPESSNRRLEISFEDCDTSHVKFLHHDALVIMLKMK